MTTASATASATPSRVTDIFSAIPIGASTQRVIAATLDRLTVKAADARPAVFAEYRQNASYRGHLWTRGPEIAPPEGDPEAWDAWAATVDRLSWETDTRGIAGIEAPRATTRLWSPTQSWRDIYGWTGDGLAIRLTTRPAAAGTVELVEPDALWIVGVYVHDFWRVAVTGAFDEGGLGDGRVWLVAGDERGSTPRVLRPARRGCPAAYWRHNPPAEAIEAVQRHEEALGEAEARADEERILAEALGRPMPRGADRR